MATLRLLRAKCNGLAPDQRVKLQPFFRNSNVGKGVEVQGTAWKQIPKPPEPNANVPPPLVAPLYLNLIELPSGRKTVFVSQDNIHHNILVPGRTISFQPLNPVESASNLVPVLRYRVTENIALLLIQAIQQVFRLIVIFLNNLVAVFMSTIRRVIGRNQDDSDDFDNSDDSDRFTDNEPLDQLNQIDRLDIPPNDQHNSESEAKIKSRM
jgi:hypothetical protein